MDSAIDTAADIPVRYLLTSRLSPEGQVSITLKLYRGQKIALTRPVATVERNQTAEVMRKCRQHLGKLGLQGVTSDTFRSRDALASEVGLPPASRLFQKHR